MAAVNRFLAKRLIRPVVSGIDLLLNPACSPADIAFALVPGVAFDASGGRLGYGKGYFDRLLPQLRCPTVGVGFPEQLSSEPLPLESHDISVGSLLLV